MGEYGIIVLIVMMIAFVYTGRVVGYAEGRKGGYLLGYQEGVMDGQSQAKNEIAKAAAFSRLAVESEALKVVPEITLYEKERA